MVLKFAPLWEVDLKYVKSIEMSCRRRLEKISWMDRVKNKEVLHRINDEKNMLHQLKRRKADWICRILRRNRRKHGRTDTTDGKP
jgi:hypothetical protein